MTDYVPPLEDMRFVIHELSGLQDILNLPAFSEIDGETVDQVLEEAGRFAADVLAPLNIPGDQQGCAVVDRAVTVADGFAEAYRQFAENGWQSLPAPEPFGGMGFPEVAGTAANEMWQSANISFALCPMLTAGAIVAIDAHGSDELKNRFLSKMVDGSWTGTMNLTEPQAGSDLAATTTKAKPDGDRYRILGTKIYITWGDHPMSDNIVHLVLARLEGAPAGIRGLSLFAVPKFLVNDDGSLGEQNDVFPASVEHKLGIHASPTCVMSFGDNEGAVGYLVGELNHGLACMFTMMNHARLNVGVQGLSISERAYQLAKGFAKDRVQGRAPGIDGRVTIVHHADVRRMLLVMKAQSEAMRAAAYFTAFQLDAGHHLENDDERSQANSRMALLTPIVKGWMTEVAQEVTSLGVQVHGGMGFVEETGAAQHMRDARILTIYEGTTGIQANDLVGRKILSDDGQAAFSLIADMRETETALAATADFTALQESLKASIDHFEEAVRWLVANAPDDQNVPGAASVNLLMLAGTVLGGWQMARAAIAVTSESEITKNDPLFGRAKLITANFYGAHILPRSYGYLRAATAGTESVMSLAEESF